MHALSEELQKKLSVEWQECRTTIGRLDGVLVDLRRFGFSFILTLLTAEHLLALDANLPARAFASVLVMLLIDAVFAVDVYYQCLLSGAVERALDIEAHSGLPTRMTKVLSVNAYITRWEDTILWLYRLLLACALITAIPFGNATGAASAGGAASATEPWLNVQMFWLSAPTVVTLLSLYFIKTRQEAARTCGVFGFNSRRIWPEGDQPPERTVGWATHEKRWYIPSSGSEPGTPVLVVSKVELRMDDAVNP